MSRRSRRPARARKESPTHGSARALRVILGVAAVALAIAAYLNALDNPFVYDDTDTVLLNRSLVDLSNIRFILLYSRFRPVVNLSYAIDRAMWGYTSFGFHVTNIALHAVVVGLFFGWCTRAFADACRTDQTARPEWPAFFAASAFAVHPMLTEGAGYISETVRGAVLARVPRMPDPGAPRDPEGRSAARGRGSHFRSVRAGVQGNGSRAARRPPGVRRMDLVAVAVGSRRRATRLEASALASVRARVCLACRRRADSVANARLGGRDDRPRADRQPSDAVNRHLALHRPAPDAGGADDHSRRAVRHVARQSGGARRACGADRACGIRDSHAHP